MTLKEWAKKLRHTADVIDELFQIEGTPAIAKKILSNLPKRKYTKRTTGRKPMSLAARRAIGRRMKKSWAERKAAA
jgi:hypothetical protein